MEWHGWGPYKWPQIHGVGHFTPKKWSETTLFWGEMKKIMQLLLVILRKFPLIVHSWGGLVSYNDRWWNFRDFWDSGKSMQNCPDAVRVMLEPSIVTMVGCMVAMFSYLDLSQIKLGSLKNLNVGFVLAGLFFALVFCRDYDESLLVGRDERTNQYTFLDLAEIQENRLVCF